MGDDAPLLQRGHGANHSERWARRRAESNATARGTPNALSNPRGDAARATVYRNIVKKCFLCVVTVSFKLEGLIFDIQCAIDSLRLRVSWRVHALCGPSR